MIENKELLVSIVIPVCNEASVLQNHVQQICQELAKAQGFQWEILLIENGSTDDTALICQQLASASPQIRWFQSGDGNYGRAMQCGFLQAQGDIIVNFDIDYWDVKFIEVAAYVMRVRYDVVIASKNLLLSRDRRSFTRKCASYVFRLMLFFFFGLRVSDTHGIKAWRNCAAMRQLFENSTPAHHTYDTEIIIRAMHNHHEVLEVPIEVVETRASDRHIIWRVPKALKELYWLHKRLS